MINKDQILTKMRQQYPWTEQLDQQELDQTLIPLNEYNSLFVLQTPEEDLGLLVKSMGDEIFLHLMGSNELFFHGDKITMNRDQMMRFIDVD